MICGICHREGCQIVSHQLASNHAQIKETQARVVAKDEAQAEDRKVQPASSGGIPEVLQDMGTGGKADAKQRWSRDKYNAYQRDLMRKRRASKREKVLGDGGGTSKVGSKAE